MLQTLRLTCAVAALAASTLVPSLASAQTESKGKASHGYNAWAYFWETNEDPEGCGQWETNLDVTERWVKSESGRMEHLIQLDFLSVGYDETCSEWPTSIVGFTTVIPAKAFKSQGLKSASLQTWVQARDFDGTVVPIAIDLVWTGGLYSDGKNSHGFSGATVSGSLLLGSKNLLISSDSIYGELLAYKGQFP